MNERRQGGGIGGVRRPPIYMDCPGRGGNGNLSDGESAQCQFCNERLPLNENGIPQHFTPDVLAMIKRGDFG